LLIEIIQLAWRYPSQNRGFRQGSNKSNTFMEWIDR
jgi:hypothetical protein